MRVGDFFRSAFVNGLAASSLVPRTFRVPLLRAAGIAIGPGSTIGPGCRLIGEHITVGADVFVNSNCVLDGDAEDIDIGDRCALGPGVMLLTTGHTIGIPAQRAGTQHYEPVRIGAGAWLGARSVVLGGVTIGEGCVIAAGSVVTRDCEANGLYAGVPALRKRDI
jgi:maltose O-acetyltransferase